MVEDFGVIYFNHGQKHLARLTVSLLSLRKHYGGPATILDTGESGGITEKIAADDRLNVEVQRIKMKAYRRHSCYVRKASLWRDSPYPMTIFLDADTVVVKSIEPLIDIVCDRKNAGFVVTRFSDWVTTGSIVGSRIQKWREVEVKADPGRFAKSIDVRGLVKECLDSPHPAVNTGVMGWREDEKRTLGAWERLAQAGWRNIFTDELAAQLIVRQEPHTMLSDRYNCSPIYGSEKGKVVIWHAHGKKHLTRADGRGAEAHKIWEPLFREAFQGNVGGILNWAPAGDETLANNMRLFGTD